MSGPGMRGIPGIGDSGDTAAVTPIIGHAETPGNTPAFLLLLRHCPALNIAPTSQHLVGRQNPPWSPFLTNPTLGIFRHLVNYYED